MSTKRSLDTTTTGTTGTTGTTAKKTKTAMVFDPVYRGARYRCDTPAEVKPMLNRYGVAIIKVLTQAQCEAMVAGMWDWLERISAQWSCGPIKRADRATHVHIYKLFPKHSFLLQHFGIGHAQWVWMVRQYPEVVRVFATIWGVDPLDLLCSFDGASTGMAPEDTGKGWYDNTKSWLHADQRVGDSSEQCYQSWVTGLPVRKGGQTLMFYEGSSIHHAEFARKFGASGGWKKSEDWVPLKEEAHHQFFLDRGCVLTAIECDAGDMVLWDSRTIHCGKEADRGRAEPDFRCVAYVCMTPRAKSDGNNLTKKQEYFFQSRTTSHWPHRVHVFGKLPNTYGAPIEPMAPVPRPKNFGLTLQGLRLAGFHTQAHYDACVRMDDAKESGDIREAEAAIADLKRVMNIVKANIWAERAMIDLARMEGGGDDDEDDGKGEE